MIANLPAAAERYEKLANMLRPWAACWNQSILHHWPLCRDALPEAWWRPLMSWSLPDMHRLDEAIAGAQPIARDCPGPEALFDFLEGVQPLLAFPPMSSASPWSESKNLPMTAKKQHEIGAILTFLAARKTSLGLERIVDIGGGMGHLARTLSKKLELQTVSIDRDAALQDAGRALLQKLKLENLPLQFVNRDLEAGPQDIDAHFDGACLSLGLHTCGPLAWTHLKKSQTSLAILNFGCCYDRMDATRDCQQSLLSQKHPLPFTSFALFLATRGRRRTLTELGRQQQVNTYRLALHLFLKETGQSDGFMTVGDAARAVYDQGFEAYAADRFQFLQRDFTPYRDKAVSFIQRPDVATAMREFFVLNVVRNVFARPLEVLLLLDRVLWMEEQGHDVDLRPFFDHSLSPRNLGIFAVKKTFP